MPKGRKPRRSARVHERDVAEAFAKFEKGMRSVLELAASGARARRWPDVAEDVIGGLGDLAPELRVLRAARCRGVAPARDERWRRFVWEPGEFTIR